MDHEQTLTSPRIETARLLLRWFEANDLDAFYELGTDPQVIRYVGNMPFASLDVARQTLESAPLKDYATHGYGRFACVWKESGRVIGFSGPKFLPELGEVDLGYRFLPPFWGKGLATESCHAVVAHARDVLQIRRLIALIHPDNRASSRVVAKLGFSFERKAVTPWYGNECDLYARKLEFP